MSSVQRPVLCVVAGPNGSGKTSTTEKLLANEWTADSVYINPDNIAQSQFGDWNSQDAVMKAAKEATRLRYFIRFFYVCTENPNINVLRIAQRYLNGGHEVPISKIFSRYYKSLTFAAQAIRFVDRAYVYDNSRENELPQLLYRTSEGSVFKRYSDNIPLWAESLI